MTKREMTAEELKSLFRGKKSELRITQRKGAEQGTIPLDTMRKIAKENNWSTEEDEPDSKMSASEKDAYDAKEKEKKEQESAKIKKRKDEQAGLNNSLPPQGVHIKNNNLMDDLLREHKKRQKRREENKPYLPPQGIKKSILKSLGSKPKTSLLDTINSIRSNPEEIFQERTKAVTGTERPDRVRSKSRVQFDRDRQQIDTQMWNKRRNPYEDVPIEELPEKDPKDEKKTRRYIDKGMKLPGAVDGTKVEHGPLFSQQMGKGIAELTLDLMSEHHQPYTNPTVAELSEGEKDARDMALYQSPFANEKLQNEENEIEDRIINAGEMPGSVESAAPYMKSYSNNPAEMHDELLGDTERNQLESIREESDRNLKEKLLPELKRKYMVPGMKRSGHLNKEVGDLIEKYSRGRTSAINQAMTKNRLGTLGVAQKHTALQGNAAYMSAKNAQDDTEKEMKTTNMMSIAKKQRHDTRNEYIKDEERRGMIDRDLHQRKMNADQIRFIEARDHPVKQLALGATIHRGLDMKPFVQESTVNQLRENPNAVNPNLFQNMGNGFRGLAADRMPKKKGGLIKTRCKKADGGQIMQEAVKNAVIDKDDPLTALRRLMNRQRMMDVSESKIGRRRYRDGGSVNPIQAGASQARQLLGEKDLRAHIESQKTPYAKPTGTSMIDSFMRGFESREAGGGAYTRGADIRDRAGENERAQKDKAFRDTYALDKDVKKEEAALRKEALEERKMLSLDKYRIAKLKKGEKALSDVKKDALKAELKKKLDEAIYKRDTALNLNAATKGVSTGRWVGGAAKIPYIGHGVASLLTGFSSSPTELQAADDASEEFFSARKPTQGRETNIQTADRRKAKAGLDKGENFNSSQTRNFAQTDQSDVNSILSEYAKYAEPYELKDYVHQYKDQKELADNMNGGASTPKAPAVDQSALRSSLESDEAELARLESEG